MFSAKYTLWYVRRDQRVTGPFPEKVIHEHLLLGRLTTETQVSVDEKHWQRLADFPHLIPDVMTGNRQDPDVAARFEVARRWADERLAIDRRTVNGPTAHPNRRGGDRRAEEPNQVISHRKLKTHLVLERRQLKRGEKWLIVPLLVVISAVLFGVVFMTSAPVPVAQSHDCAAPPSPGVHWAHCELRGSSLSKAKLTGINARNVNLSGSDLSHAVMTDGQMAFADLSLSNLSGVDLSASSLVGANFQGSVLSGADLSHTDVSYADFRGADLTDVDWSKATLDRAIWFDGTVCERGSLGACLTARESIN